MKKGIRSLSKHYHIKDMRAWKNVHADLIITDPPFGIKFNGKRNNYNRDKDAVVGGYVEWSAEEYRDNIRDLLSCVHRNLKETGQALIFSGWNNSNIIHDEIEKSQGLRLRGKLYWAYNFAPACKRKPAHNVYEIFWLTKSDRWCFQKRCSTSHCMQGEANLSLLPFRREFLKGVPKYPTRLPYQLLKCIIEHFSKEYDLVFDPLAGSGMIGIASHLLQRKSVQGDVNKKGRVVFNHLSNYYHRSIKILEKPA
ncbi:MAG: site-specific DNA-methyltransferase [Bacteroidota bacterium]